MEAWDGGSVSAVLHKAGGHPSNRTQRANTVHPSSVSTFLLLQITPPSPNNMSCMRWIPVKNLKQLTVSPLRPRRCLSMCACTETHKSSPFPPQTAVPRSLLRVSIGYHSNPSLSLSLFVDLHMNISTIKARLLLSELPDVDVFFVFFVRLEVIFRGGLAQGATTWFSPSVSFVLLNSVRDSAIFVHVYSSKIIHKIVSCLLYLKKKLLIKRSCKNLGEIIFITFYAAAVFTCRQSLALIESRESQGRKPAFHQPEICHWPDI